MSHIPERSRQVLRPAKGLPGEPLMKTPLRSLPARRGAAQLSLLLTVAFSLGLFVASDSGQDSACVVCSWFAECCEGLLRTLEKFGSISTWTRLSGIR